MKILTGNKVVRNEVNNLFCWWTDFLHLLTSENVQFACYSEKTYGSNLLWTVVEYNQIGQK